MIIYLLLFMSLAALALAKARLPLGFNAWRHTQAFDGLDWAVLVVITCIIGLRFQVGGDWGPYLYVLDYAGKTTPWNLITEKGPSYQLINWVSYQLGLGIYGVNLVCGFIFTYGLVAFCKTLPRPWLAVTVATPYLITVVAMGYTRQAVAIGLFMLAASFLIRGKRLPFVFLIVVATTFHKPAIAMIGFLIFTFRGHILLVAVPIIFLILGFAWYLLGDYFLLLYKNYVIAEYQSGGALIRTGMTALPATIFLLFRKHFMLPGPVSRFWWAMALVAISMFGLALASPATTAIDRMALYFIPIQLLVTAYLPDILKLTAQSMRIMKSLIISAYALSYAIWIGFATHAHAWIPYKSVLGLTIPN